MSLTQEQMVQELWDRTQIQNVLALYCRAIDRMDKELLKSVYHPDGTDDHGSFSGNAHQFSEFIMPELARVIRDGMHTVTHTAIEVKGNFATSESYYLAYQTCPGGIEQVTEYFGPTYAQARVADGTIEGDHDYICGGRYIDLFEKRNGEWKVLRRKITNEFNLRQPSTRITQEGAIKAFNLPGLRNRQDPVYLNKLP